jgi:hypothetical protein
MAGFEVIVRPVVFPNIRPAPPRVLPPEENSEQGLVVIKGSGAKQLSASYSWSVSVSRQRPHKEAKRQFDKERVHQKDKDGKINKKNYIDVERLKRVRFDTEEGPYKVLYADPPKTDNVETLETDVTRTPSSE